MVTIVKTSDQISVGDIVIWNLFSKAYPFGHAGIVTESYSIYRSAERYVSIMHALSNSNVYTEKHIAVSQILSESSGARFYSPSWTLFLGSPGISPQNQLLNTMQIIQMYGGGSKYYPPRLLQMVTGLSYFGRSAKSRLSKYHNRLAGVTQIPLSVTSESSIPLALAASPLVDSSLSPSTAPSISPIMEDNVLSPFERSVLSSSGLSQGSNNSQTPALSPKQPIIPHLTCTEFVILSYQLAFHDQRSDRTSKLFIRLDAKTTTPRALGLYLESKNWEKYKIVVPDGSVAGRI